MRRRGLYWFRAVLCAGAVFTSAACYSTISPRARTNPREPVCERSTIQVPECGVLWGVTTQTPTIEGLRQVEVEVGRDFDMIYRFHAIGDAVPTTDERRVAASGRVLHLALDSGGLATASEPGQTWNDVAVGRYDSELRRMADGIATLQRPVFVTFDHEANNPSKLVRGDPSQFVAAWRHVHAVFDNAGATNAIWVWVMMGSIENLSTIGTYWPGNTYVDWISWDVYNQSGCLAGSIDPAQYESFGSAALRVYRWVHDHGASVRMDPNKPMMISEAGSVVYPDDPQLTAQWYAEIPSVLGRYPQIKALSLWDHTGNRLCDYRFEDNATVSAAVVKAGMDPRINTTER